MSTALLPPGTQAEVAADPEQAQPGPEKARNHKQDPQRVQTLITDLKNHPDPDVRKQAAIELGRLSADKAGLVVTALLEALNDPSPMVRETTATVLGPYGKSDERVVPALCQLLKEDEDVGVVGSACLAVGYMGIRAKHAVPQMVLLLNDKRVLNDNRALNCSLSGLRYVKEAAAPAVPRLIEMLRDPTFSDHWWRISSTLGAIGSESREAIPIMVIWLQSEDLFIVPKRHAELPKLVAVEALRGIGIATPAVIQEFTKILADQKSSAYLRTKVTEALGKMGASAKAALPRLMDLKNDPDLDVRFAAIRAITAIVKQFLKEKQKTTDKE